MSDRIGIGIIGSGFIAGIHARAYQQAAHQGAQLIAVASRQRENAEAFARRYTIPAVYDDAMGVIEDRNVQAIDLAVPNALHHQLAIAAAQAGKHVICEKPLTGAFGDGDRPRAEMLTEALQNADAMIAAARAHDVQIMYAENLIYAPAIQKVERLIAASGGVLLDIRGEESHSGSHAAYSRSWRASGGGSLLRLGTHPIGVALYLKRREGLARSGVPILPIAVTAEVGALTKIPAVQAHPTPWLVRDWQDVEDWAAVVVTFSDGARGTFVATDVMLGGMRDRMEFSLSNARIICDMTHAGPIRAYAPSGEVFADEYLAEKLETKAGWSFPSADEEWTLGHPQEVADFVGAIRENRAPRSDAELGRDVVNVIYSAYLAAAEGRRVTLRHPGGA
jgi:predicted dehydrogenase